ncbi:MAG: glycoside hydrolase family 97 protein [Bacteroidota bacterium]
MKITLKFLFLALGLSVVVNSCSEDISTKVSSPDQDLQVAFQLTGDDQPTWQAKYNKSVVVDKSNMGFDFKDMPYLGKNMEIVKVEHDTFNETWETVWGEKREVKNHYNEMMVALQEKDEPNRLINIRFRVYDDGLAFRYEFPEQENMTGDVIILDERTRFNMTDDHTTWWIPGDWDIYEHLYNKTPITEIDAKSKRDNPNLGQTYIPFNAVNTPVTMKTDDGIHLSIHEADLTNYAGMTLRVDKDDVGFTSELVGSERLGHKVKREMPFNTPWRTVQVSETAAGLIEGSDIYMNLNEPNKIDDVSWIEPAKYMGIWWEMHLGKSTWDISGSQDAGNVGSDADATGTGHGATTENTKRYIDFASQNGIDALLVEGWNTGWENWTGIEDREGVFDFVTPYDDYDLEEVVEYGKDKGVEIMMHHETSAAPRTYEQQLDTAYSLMESLGLHSVKTGYVGEIIPEGEYHHGQWMVNHYQKVIEKAAQHEVMVNAHEPVKATGKRRTWPNEVSREGLRGQEYNAWASDGGNPPDHLPKVTFTRMLSGPIDFTPGIFNLKLDPYKEDNQVSTTLAKQLALYVVIYSPLQMAADLPENYEEHPAFQFIRDVGVDWEQTRVLNGEIGEYVTIAREERGTGNWFLGAITNEEPREMEIQLDFLPEGETYQATIYRDDSEAHWDDNPAAFEIEEKEVDASTVLPVDMAPGGGVAVSIMK